MADAQHLADDVFATVVRSAPLVSIDLIISDPMGHALVGLRTNEPAKGCYFVPGGIIRKNETLDRAFARIVKAELGWDLTRSSARLLGVYEHLYAANRFGDPSFGTHYVVLAHKVDLAERRHVTADAQHSVLQWMPAADLRTRPDVHEYTRAYFQ